MEEELYCIGCGVKLQDEDETKEGYVDPRALKRDFILCKRCYQLKHYGKFVKSDAISDTFELLKKNASKDDLIVLICDVALTSSPLNKKLRELNNFDNVIIAANRYDMYEDYLTKEKVHKFLKNEVRKAKLDIDDIFIASEDNINEIFNYIDNHTIGKNAYLVGFENAGKSTFINNILKVVAKEKDDVLVKSSYPGTTIDLIKIPLADDNFIIDSPGLKSEGNLLNYVDKDFIKNAKMDKKVDPKDYQLNCGQSLIVSNIIKFDYVKGEKQGIVFYGPKSLEINRSKIENSYKTFNNIMPTLHVKTTTVRDVNQLETHEFEIEDEKKHDLVIEGIGFFTLKKGKYRLSTLKGTNVFIRNSLI